MFLLILTPTVSVACGIIIKLGNQGGWGSGDKEGLRAIHGLMLMLKGAGSNDEVAPLLREGCRSPGSAAAPDSSRRVAVSSGKYKHDFHH